MLFGKVIFSGKLPMTFPASLRGVHTLTTAQYPDVVDANGVDQVKFSEGLAVGYKWYQSRHIAPLFPFGYGLTYTSFRYSHPQVRVEGRGITVAVRVTNTGHRDGVEIPQVYLTLPRSSGEPGSRLVGFQRVSLRPGQSTQVVLTVAAAASNHPFSVWDTARNGWQVSHGRYHVGIGGDAQAQPLNVGFTY